jgi:hypothetical protein
MRRQRAGALGALLVVLGVCAAGVLAPDDARPKEKMAQPGATQEPGGTTEAAGLAATQPDEFAWQLFLFINRQARPGSAGVADPKKPTIKDYDDDADVVWESWALSSSDTQPNGSEIFLPHGAKPQPWEKLDRVQRATRPGKLGVNLLLAHQRLLHLDAAALNSDKPLKDLLSPTPVGVEVRMNRAAFDMIRDNELYSRTGLAAAYQKAQAADNPDFIQFAPAAKAVKGAWGPIDDAQKPRYHWRTINGKTYGLLALHVTTKDLPLWFWCDFIHADVEPQEPGPSQDTTTRGPGAAHGKDGVRDETAGSKWANYRLKGSQTEFTDARGQPTRLGNHVLEGSNVSSSSCITCHAMAGIDATGQGKVYSFPVGVPPTSEFGFSGGRLLQTDFLYSMPHRAQK